MQYDDDGIIDDTGHSSSSSSTDGTASSYCSVGALAAAITTVTTTAAAAAVAAATAAVPRQRAQSAGPVRAPLQRNSYSSISRNGWLPQAAALQPLGVVYLEPFRYDWQRAAAVETAAVAAAPAVTVAAATAGDTQLLQHCLAVTCISRQQLAWLE
jgi:hypothetical protein